MTTVRLALFLFTTTAAIVGYDAISSFDLLAGAKKCAVQTETTPQACFKAGLVGFCSTDSPEGRIGAVCNCTESRYYICCQLFAKYTKV